MFTGLIADLGRVESAERTSDGLRLLISTRLAPELRPGDSVAVNGVCLTVTDTAKDGFTADVVPETLRRSSLGEAEAGMPVNLELPLKSDGRFGGHMVLGHVDGVGRIVDSREDGLSRVLTVRPPESLLRYIVEKGSIAVDGISLTVARLVDGSFELALIPETLSRTTLGTAGPATPVNLEVDILAKHVEKLLGARE